MNCGVYQIKNTLNGKAYIGSSKNIKRRLGIHRSMLRRGTHRNPHLQNAWNKYGESAFVMVAVCEAYFDEGESIYRLKDREPTSVENMLTYIEDKPDVAKKLLDNKHLWKSLMKHYLD